MKGLLVLGNHFGNFAGEKSNAGSEDCESQIFRIAITAAISIRLREVTHDIGSQASRLDLIHCTKGLFLLRQLRFSRWRHMIIIFSGNGFGFSKAKLLPQAFLQQNITQFSPFEQGFYACHDQFSFALRGIVAGITLIFPQNLEVING